MCARAIEVNGRLDIQLKRVQGFKKVLEDHYINFSEEKIIETSHFYFEEEKECYKNKLKSKKDLDAIFCAASDPVAIGIMHAAQNADVRIPDDIYKNLLDTQVIHK